jgi:hypothetical protein
MYRPRGSRRQTSSANESTEGATECDDGDGRAQMVICQAILGRPFE